MEDRAERLDAIQGMISNLQTRISKPEGYGMRERAKR